jgi:importin-9
LTENPERKSIDADGDDDKIVQTCFDETYELRMSVFISKLQTFQKILLGIKRFVVKILTVIFRDFTHYSKKSLQTSILLVWKFFNQLMPL